MSIAKLIFFIIISILTFGTFGCGDSKPANNSANSAPNINAVKTNSNANSFTGTKTEEGSTTNAAATIAPLMQTYYDALKKKDDAALHKFYSAAALKELESGMKSEGRKSLVDYVESAEPAGDKPFEVRNEKVEGDTAIAEIKGGSYATWIKWKFVKENGEWKKAPPSEDLKLMGK